MSPQIAPNPMLRALPNLIASMFRYLNDLQYTVGADTKTLKQFFPGLIIFPAYPDDLTTLKSPVLALGGAEFSQVNPDLFGSVGEDIMFRFPIYGFVCGQRDNTGQSSDGQNKFYRDRLMSDLYEIFTTTAANEGIDLYDADSKLVISSIEAVGCAARTIPTNAPNVDADRYRFLVEVDLAFDAAP